MEPYLLYLNGLKNIHICFVFKFFSADSKVGDLVLNFLY
jgi:hypothetical protein